MFSVPRRLRLHIAASSDRLRPGDRVSLKAMLYPVPAQILPYGRDMQRELYFAGIGGVGYSYGGARRIASAEDETGGGWREWVMQLRTEMTDRIHAVLPDATGGVADRHLLGLGEDPSFVNGGVIASLGKSSHTGTGDLFVVEADESDGSFLLYDTAVALITNVDPDHLDHYGSLEAFEDAFVTFAREADEFVVVSSDDPGAVHVTGRLREQAPEKRIVTFGEAEDAEVRVHFVVTDGPVSHEE